MHQDLGTPIRSQKSSLHHYSSPRKLCEEECVSNSKSHSTFCASVMFGIGSEDKLSCIL